MDEAEVGDVKRLLVLVEGEAAGWQREAARSRLEPFARPLGNLILLRSFDPSSVRDKKPKTKPEPAVPRPLPYGVLRRRVVNDCEFHRRTRFAGDGVER